MVRGIFSFRTFFYLTYAVLLIAVLLYIRFPTEKFKMFCERRVVSYFSESTCNIDRIAYRFPFSLVVSDFQISQEVDGEHSEFHVNQLTVTIDPANLFRTFAIDGALYGGSFSLKLDYNGVEKSFRLNDVLIKDFNVNEWTDDWNLLGRKVSGTAEFSGNYQAGFDSPLAGVGEGVLVVVDGSMELLQPVLSLSSFEFSRIDIEMVHEKGVLRFSKGNVSGAEVSADFTGEMKTTSPLQNSSILLSGHLTPEEGFLAVHPEEQKLVEQLSQRYKMAVLPFRVGGSVRRPIFRFSM